MPKVSVIVPVYNTAAYLRRCIDSICQQTLQDIEIIVLNDGSPDNAQDIMQEFIERDLRIKYHAHANIGLGRTRNIGINLAQGVYLAFVDSDDYLEPSMIEDLYVAAMRAGAEVACCETYLVRGGKASVVTSFGKDETVELSPQNRAMFYRNYYFANKYTHAAWDKLVRRDFVQKHKAHFGDNRVMFTEDNYFQLQLLKYATRICFVAKPRYNYIVREGSIMNSFQADLVTRHLHMVKVLHSILTNPLPADSAALSLVAYEALVYSVINCVRGQKGPREVAAGMRTFSAHPLFSGWWRLAPRSAMLEPKASRRWFFLFTMMLLRLRLIGVASMLMFLVYRGRPLPRFSASP